MDRPAPSDDLSDRELAVVRGIAGGNTYRQIAADLGIGLETVRTHAASIRHKLKTTKAGIAAWAVRTGKV